MKEQIEKLIKKYEAILPIHDSESLHIPEDEKQARKNIVNGFIADLENLLKSEQ